MEKVLIVVQDYVMTFGKLVLKKKKKYWKGDWKERFNKSAYLVEDKVEGTLVPKSDGEDYIERMNLRSKKFHLFSIESV